MSARIALGMALLGLTLSTSACTRQAEAPGTAAGAASSTATASAVPATLIHLNVEGMQCAFECKPKVEAALAGVEGVESVEVDFESKTATVKCDKALDPALLVKALPEQFTATVTP